LANNSWPIWNSNSIRPILSIANEVWTEAVREAKELVKEAQKRVIERNRTLGIPARFAPKIEVSWYDAGEQAFDKRVVELRRIGKTQIDAMIAAASVKLRKPV